MKTIKNTNSFYVLGVKFENIHEAIFYAIKEMAKNGRTRQTLWSAVHMLTQKLCFQTIHDCPKVVPLHYESE